MLQTPCITQKQAEEFAWTVKNKLIVNMLIAVIVNIVNMPLLVHSALDERA